MCRELARGASLVDSVRIIEVFNQLFADEFQTKLIGGGEQPFYRCEQNHNRICFRHDYESSALHEVAHWCLAGARRRQQSDYGYWYKEDRSEQEQQEFQCLERRPQALEWIFSIAAGVHFRVSVNNFEANNIEAFKTDVQRKALQFTQIGLPKRAQRFASTLATQTGRKDYMQDTYYVEKPGV